MMSTTPMLHCKNGGVMVTPWCHSDGCSDSTSVLLQDSGVMLTLMNFQTCHHDNIQCNSDTRGCRKLNITMNTDTYSQGYIYKLKTLHSRVDEVGKLIC